MSSLVESNRSLINVAMGRECADFVIKNGLIVNVATGEIIKGDIAVKNKRIAFVGDASHTIGSLTKVFDVNENYIVPGFLDGHVHVESAMVTITQFARGVLPHGTTGVFIDPHEIANVLGAEGVKVMIKEGEEAPLRVYVSIPSCVPASSPEFETTGAEIGPKEVEELMKYSNVVALGEVMNYPGVINLEDKMIEEINIALKHNKVVEGHFYGNIKELNAYAASGISSSHESTTKEIGLAKARVGMYVMIREGSAWKDLKEVIRIVTEQKIDSRRVCLVSDDRHPEDIINEGHMDYIIRRAIEEGVDPIKAIQMVTINTAEHFNVDHDVGMLTPGKLADIVILDDLRKVSVDMVFVDGKLIARKGKLLEEIKPFEYPNFTRKTVRLKEKLTPEKFKVQVGVEKNKVKINVIKVIEASALTKKEVLEVPVRNGFIEQDIKMDLSKVASIERHKASGEMGLGFVTGFGFKSGAVASTVAHDNHNLLVIGTNDEDMAFACNELEKVGGGMIAVKEGKILAVVKLPIAGLISDEPIEKVSEDVKKLQEAWKFLGCNLIHPFMTMSLLSLSVLPEIRVTNKGLIDTMNFKKISLVSS
ncbi:MAG: adenine deaminase [Candidatus Brockarchaeota archaeon]|nr:adenine deaminase [Candidatus Brockarchaeota archaeon]